MTYKQFKNSVIKKQKETALSFKGKTVSYLSLAHNIDKLAQVLELSNWTKLRIGLMVDHPILNVICLLCAAKLKLEIIALVPQELKEEKNKYDVLIFEENDTSVVDNLDGIPSICLNEVLEDELDLNSIENDLISDARLLKGYNNFQINKGLSNTSYTNYVDWFGAKMVISDEEIWGVEIYSGSANELRLLLPLLLKGITIHLFDAQDFKLVATQYKMTHLNLSASTLNNMLRNNIIDLLPPYLILFSDVSIHTTFKSIVPLAQKSASFKGVYCMFGSIETTFVCSYQFIPKEEIEHCNTFNIGHAISKVGLLVLDNNLKLVSKGLIGDLYAAGACVANSSTQLAHKFQKDPFGTQEMKIFNTGIRARYADDSSVTIVKENENEIFIDGKYVQRSFIESTVAKSPKIDQCVIVKKLNENKSTSYVLFVTTKNSTLGAEELIRSYAFELGFGKLIESMELIQVPNFPRDKHGNIDLEILQQVDVQLCANLKNLEKANLNMAAAHVLGWPIKKEDKSISGLKNKKNTAIPVKREIKDTDVKALLKAPELDVAHFSTKNVIDFLAKTAKNFPNKGIQLVGHRDPIFLSYADLYNEAKKVASGLARKNVNQGDRVILQIEDQQTFFPIFWGCLLRGVTPLVIGVPPVYDPLQGLAKKIYKSWHIMEKPLLICNDHLLDDIIQLSLDLEMQDAKLCATSEIILANFEEEDLYNNAPEDLIFFLMTSGSTGMPKCIKIDHEGALSHIFGIKEHMGLSAEDVIVNMLPIDHITPLLSLHIRAVVLGANQVHINIAQFLNNPLIWLDTLETYKGTHTFSPNFAYKLVTESLTNKERDRAQKRWDLSSVKSFKNGGELINYEVVKDFFAVTAPYQTSITTFQPAYGMTEVAGAVTLAQGFNHARDTYAISVDSDMQVDVVDESDENALSLVTVGAPIHGTSIRIANTDNKLLNTYEIGSVQLKGNVVTKGYLNNKEAGKKVFLKDGWFKTGDLGFIANDQLIITGRENDLIIYNGINYYAYELEFVLNNIEGIESNYVAVLSYSLKENTEGIAVFFTPIMEEVEHVRTIIVRIKGALASHFGITPSIIVPISHKEFARTDSGKTNKPGFKRQLIEEEYGELFEKVNQYRTTSLEGEIVVYVTTKELLTKIREVSSAVTIKFGDSLPKTTADLFSKSFQNIETNHTNEISRRHQKLLAIWKAVLNVDEVKVDSNFFELGGNSLKAIQIITRISEGLQIQLDLKDLFNNPTIDGLVKCFAENDAKLDTQIHPTEEADHYELSNAQKRLWILYKQEVHHYAYNMLEAYNLKGDLNVNALSLAFNALIRRHDILRTIFVMVKGEPRQKILASIDFEIAYLNHIDSKDFQLEEELQKEILQPFNLEEGPLLRATLFKTTNGEHIFLFSMHHIISDGWSFEVIISEVMQYYHMFNTNMELNTTPLSIQYKDYTAWYNRLLSSDILKQNRRYWERKLSLPLTTLDLIESKPRPGVKSYDGKVLSFSLNRETSSQILQNVRQNNTTVFHFFVALIKVLLFKHTKQNDIIVGAPIAGRTNYQLENQIGFYLNNLVLRDEVKEEINFLDFQKEVRTTILEAYENQWYPFDLLVENLKVKTDPGRNPIYDILVVMDTGRTFIEGDQDFNMHKDNFVTAESIALDYPISKLDLTFFIKKDDTNYELELEYRTDLISESLIQRMAEDLKNLIQGALLNANSTIKELLENTYTTFEKDEKENFKYNIMEELSGDF